MNILRTILLMLVFISPAHSLEWDWYGDETKIILHGDINTGDGAAFQNLMEDSKFDKVTAVVIGPSSGGAVRDAWNIGAVIHLRGLSTFTIGECYSACVVVAASGAKKYVTSEARLGVHWISPQAGQYVSAKDASASTQDIYRMMWEYYELVGIKADVMMYLQLQAGPYIRILSKNELSNLGFNVEKY